MTKVATERVRLKDGEVMLVRVGEHMQLVSNTEHRMISLGIDRDGIRQLRDVLDDVLRDTE